jgi:hypothetical protein
MHEVGDVARHKTGLLALIATMSPPCVPSISVQRPADQLACFDNYLSRLIKSFGRPAATKECRRSCRRP